MRITIRRSSTLLGFLLAAIGLAGCATTTPERYPVIQSYHPDGSGGGVMPDANALEDAGGYVLSYAAGDQIVIDVTLDSDVMHVENPVTMTIILERPIRVASGPGGLLVSIDGEPWRSPTDAFDGSLSTNLSIRAKDRVNRGTVALTATAH